MAARSITSRDVTINLRANRSQRAVIDRAAETLGKNRSDFMLEAACRETGIPSFGDEGFREPLRLLLRSLRDEGRLTLLGRIAARADIAGLLATRLRLEADRNRYPAIADEAIRRPLFVVGLPRTGSTLLHHLLAQDPGGRVARAWEVMEPSPPPDRARYETWGQSLSGEFREGVRYWPRIEACAAHLDALILEALQRARFGHEGA